MGPEKHSLFRFVVALGMLVVAASGWAVDPFADSVYIPPAAKASAANDARPIDPAVLLSYLNRIDRFHTYDWFFGQNEILKAKYPEGKGGRLKIGEEVSVDLAGAELWGSPVPDGNGYLHLASISSVDAKGIRLQVDLSSLDASGEVWIIDPVAPRAHGPYKSADYPESTWLATVFGEETVLMVRTSSADLPLVEITACAHLFRSFSEVVKTVSCHLSAACESVKQSSAVAILLMGSGACTGTLIATSENPLQPYLITANHCISTQWEAAGTEAYWDYRESGCGRHDAGYPEDHPRSNGKQLLATSGQLDCTLIKLDSVPSGPYGRLYVGWDTRQLQQGDSVTAIHHPDASHMRVSYGRVTSTNLSTMGYIDETRVTWSKGVTEGGSSGCCLLLNNYSMRLCGTLSGGPAPTCGSQNYDNFSSFRSFFPKVEAYLTTSDAPPELSTGLLQFISNLINEVLDLLLNELLRAIMSFFGSLVGV